MTSEITIAKGAYSVIIYTDNVSENYDNKIISIKPGQTKQKQDTGPKNVKVVDLLIITHAMILKGYITPTATKTAVVISGVILSRSHPTIVIPTRPPSP